MSTEKVLTFGPYTHYITWLSVYKVVIEWQMLSAQIRLLLNRNSLIRANTIFSGLSFPIFSVNMVASVGSVK